MKVKCFYKNLLLGKKIIVVYTTIHFNSRGFVRLVRRQKRKYFSLLYLRFVYAVDLLYDHDNVKSS